MKTFNNWLIENEIPNTMKFWHGGNLDEYNDVIAQKTGRYEYGPGLYATTNYDIATKYSKGGRKLYLLTIEKGNDIQNSHINQNDAINFVNSYIISSKRKDIIERLNKYTKNELVPAYIFQNIILNEKAIKSINTKYLRTFLVDNGIDYEIVFNPFGFHEKMIVLYNMKKIKNYVQIKPKDKITVFNLPTDFT